MLQVKNQTPFNTHLFLFPDEQGVDTAYVVVKATFELWAGTLAIAREQRPVIMADEYWGEPGQSSVKYASEAHLMKPGTDVVLVGEAHSPRPVDSCFVALQVGALRKGIQVFGDRTWQGGVLSPRISSPMPFRTMPLVYERAFGGKHEVDPKQGKVLFDSRNPVGKGFRGKRSASDMVGVPLPNLEDPQHLIGSISDAPAPAGVGCIAPGWEPRRSLAGTYDETWQTRRAPYLPLDFKQQFFQVASPGLHSHNPLVGGEPVKLVNLSPMGVLQFQLPVCSFHVRVLLDRAEEKPALRLETVLLEPLDSRVCMTWRGALHCDKRVLKVREVHIQLEKLKGA
ncbi:DUF2169 domain-containing protein [Archangium violaceum]|uniref:DUF2169 family type VI secretion system accessory protein n=1 Tax=Archangium violaceum TaxID=83451 RepID=UPI00193B2B05|nr:DUF2169 domain-containing protein [Archangium violaceum]QRK10885.1 DUF2169 domain-containing protein [Archangium violaceum]